MEINSAKEKKQLRTVRAIVPLQARVGMVFAKKVRRSVIQFVMLAILYHPLIRILARQTLVKLNVRSLALKIALLKRRAEMENVKLEKMEQAVL